MMPPSLSYIPSVSELLRGLLVLIAGIAGWSMGGIVGIVVGFATDGDLTAAVLGAVVGAVAGIAWMGWHLGKQRT